MIEILGKTNIDFMGKRKIAFICSSVMMALGLLALVQIARGPPISASTLPEARPSSSNSINRSGLMRRGRRSIGTTLAEWKFRSLRRKTSC